MQGLVEVLKSAASAALIFANKRIKDLEKKLQLIKDGVTVSATPSPIGLVHFRASLRRSQVT